MNQGILILKKVLRSREHLINSCKSQKPLGEILPAIQKVKRWIEFYPNASERGVRSFYQNNRELIHRLLPGKESKSHEGLKTQIENYFGQPN